MPEATLKIVAQMAGVAPATVSRVVNGSENVAPTTREKILAVIRKLDYTPNMHAANLRRKRLEDASTNGSEYRSLRVGDKPYLDLPCPPETFLFSPEEARALAQQISRLRRDLDRLRNHTERIQIYMDMLQRANSRRLSSRAAHRLVEMMRGEG